MEAVADFILGAPQSLQMVNAAMKLKDTCSMEEIQTFQLVNWKALFSIRISRMLVLYGLYYLLGKKTSAHCSTVVNMDVLGKPEFVKSS